MKKIMLLCAAMLTLAVSAEAQGDLPSIVIESDIGNEVKPWRFEVKCKVTDISKAYHVGERSYYVITIELADTTYDQQLEILYGKDYRDKKVEMQIVSFDSGRLCDGTTIKKGQKYLFELTFGNDCCPIVGHGDYIPYWKVDGVKIPASIVERQPMKADGLDGLCWYYRDTNRIDPSMIIPASSDKEKQ